MVKKESKQAGTKATAQSNGKNNGNANNVSVSSVKSGKKNTEKTEEIRKTSTDETQIHKPTKVSNSKAVKESTVPREDPKNQKESKVSASKTSSSPKPSHKVAQVQETVTAVKSVKKEHKVALKENKNSVNLKTEEVVPESDIIELSKAEINMPDSDVDILDHYKTKLQEVENSLKLKAAQIDEAINVMKKIVDDKFKKNFDLLARKEDEFLYLNFIFNKLPVRYTIRPTPIDISAGIYGEKFNTRVCIIVKDPRSDFKDLNIDFPFQTKIFDVEKLRLKYNRFNERRGLLKDFDLFICDSRVYMLLKRYLGKPFFDNKKYPIPVDLDYTDPESIKKNITKLVTKKVAFYMTHGPNYNIKIGRVVMSNEELKSNIINASARVIAHILKWGVDFKDLKQISLKITNSIDLPIYNYLSPEEIAAFIS